MASWTTLPDAALEPGKPIRSIDGLALRDNPVAITEGAAGAPKMQTNGITDSAVTTAKLANNSVTTAKLDANERMTTANVLNATAGAAHQAVGSMTIAWNTTTSNVASNGTIAGSSLRFTSAQSNTTGGPANIFANNTSNGATFPTANTTALTGTWKNMGGFCRGMFVLDQGCGQFLYAWYPSLWLRIA
jgi:hypothetical protein